MLIKKIIINKNDYKIFYFNFYNININYNIILNNEYQLSILLYFKNLKIQIVTRVQEKQLMNAKNLLHL